MRAYRMDPNERLLWRVVQERSGRGRLLGLRGEWVLLGTLALVLAAAVPFVRTVAQGGSSGAGGLAPDSSVLELLAAPTSATIIGSQATPSVPTPTPEIVAPETVVARADRYVVQPGDSLQSIAARNGLRPATLASVNQLDQPDLLQPGRSLVVPPTDGLVHVVEPGETLRSIAERYGVDVERVIRANDLEDPDDILVGLRLFIPGAIASVDHTDNSTR